MTLRSCRSTRFGRLGVGFEQMTKDTKKQLKGNNDGSDTETEGEEK